MTGIILAGGKNTRIRTNKALLKIPSSEAGFKEKTFIRIIVEKLRGIFNEIIIVTNNPEEHKALRVKLVKDIIPDKGSLGGLYSGLVHSGTSHSFVVAVDMPFLNPDLIKYMKKFCPKYDVITPKIKGIYEPLHTIYSKNCLPHIEKQIQDNNLRIIEFFPKLRVKEIKEPTIRKFDPELLSFFNINTLEDYQKARELTSRVSL